MNDASKFFQGKTLVVFGSTTFPGKVLIEKLLRSCSQIEQILCPVRTKNHSAEDIFAEISTTKLFDRVRKENPKFNEKLLPIDLNEFLKSNFIDKIDLCFYLADNSINFAEQNLKDLIRRNVLELEEILHYLKRCRKLKSICYLSSIYANIDCPFIDECIYPSSIDPHRLIEALDWMDDEMLALATPKLIGTKINAFAFSHWLAETILGREEKNLPGLSIVRVSIIGAAWKEPYPGWLDKSDGPSELFVAAGRGYLRSMKSDSNDILDIVPVDIPVNLMIVASWYKSIENEGNSSTIIYHCTSSGSNPFHWQEMNNYLAEYSKRMPLEGAFRRPNLSMTSHSLIHDSYVFFSHLIPAYLADFGLKLLGQPARLVHLYKNLHRMLIIFESFTIRNEISCSIQSLNSLKQFLSETSNSSNEFYFDLRSLHWPTYIESYLIGTKKYILNEDIHCLNGAQKHLNNLRNIRWSFNTIVLVLLWRIFISKRPAARNLWFFIMNMFVAKFVRFFKIFSAGNN